MQKNTGNGINDLDLEKIYIEFSYFETFLITVLDQLEIRLGIKVRKTNLLRLLLLDIFARYKKDEFRLQIFHENSTNSTSKIIGIIAYWLLKIKPLIIDDEFLEIQMKTNHADQKKIIKKIRYVNELFVIYVIIIFVKKHIQPDFKPKAQFFDDLTYEFRYRSITQSNIQNIVDSLIGTYCDLK